MSEDITLAFKLGYALLMGGFLGMEREVHKKTAGLRTHMIVCLSSALLMVLSIEVARDEGVLGDPTRIAAGVMTGIGFLGAGTIIKHGATVHGLTTAASIWTAAAVGLAVGAGYYLSSAIVVMLTLFTLLLVQRADAYLHIYRRRAHIIVHLDTTPGALKQLQDRMDELHLDMGEMSITRKSRADDEMVVEAMVFDMGGKDRTEVASILMEMDVVKGVEFY